MRRGPSRRFESLAFLLVVLPFAMCGVTSAEQEAAPVLVADASCPKLPPQGTPEPRDGFVWVTAAYEVREGRCVLVPGHWERPKKGGGPGTSSVRDGTSPDDITMSEIVEGGSPGIIERSSRGIVEGGAPGIIEGGAPGIVERTQGAGGEPSCPSALEQAVPQPRPGFVWVAASYGVRDGRCVLSPGHWERPRR